LILPSCPFSIFAGFSQHAELLVPFAFQRISNESIIGVDQHEATLGEIRFDVGPFDRLDSAADLPLHAVLRSPCGISRVNSTAAGVILFGNQHANGFVDRRPGD